ncbi:MAG: aldehyde dehydrogenase family protein, partial [Catenulispora sp.]|nr:aldehyde dehydrogenase family protein [Catenulispora sp.]
MNALTFTDQYVGGKWIPSASATTLDVLNPATEDVLAVVPAGGAADVDAAVAAARSAARAWGTTGKAERLELLGRLVAGLS